MLPLFFMSIMKVFHSRVPVRCPHLTEIPSARQVSSPDGIPSARQVSSPDGKFSLMCAMIFGLVSIICPIPVYGLRPVIPFVAHWVLEENDNAAFTNNVDIVAYDANEIIIEDFIRIIDFDCNSKFKITAVKSGWTLPAGYPDGGAKKIDGSDSDFLIMVDNITPGYRRDGLAALFDYVNFNAILTSGSDIIGGGNIHPTHGVENAACDINAKIIMDWATDIVGAYSITVTLTIYELTV